MRLVKFPRPRARVRPFTFTAALLLLFVSVISPSVRAQSLGPFDRDSARQMLRDAKDDLKAHYHDPKFRGMDVEARFKEAEEQIKQVATRDELMITVAQLLLSMNDSHTFFLPPSRAARIEYGWRMQLSGDSCFVTAVKAKSDAEGKGLKIGDEVLAVDGYRPTREIFWKMLYRYYALMPSRSVRLVVKSPGEAKPRQIDVLSKIQQGAAVAPIIDLFVRYLQEEGDIDHDRFYESGKEMLVWKMPTFDISKGRVDDIMGRARNFKALVIDLRGNGGGRTETLERLVSYFFDRDIKIADLKGRKESKPMIAKTRGSSVFKGQLVVLVDSTSGSASELFARVLQLEKRGTVIGDRTAGAVMTSEHYPHETGVGRILFYGVSVTIFDMIMTDGKSLEHVGVTPDELLLMSGAELAAKRDPVLARAAEIVGVKLDSEKAGSLFPYEWQ